MTAPKSTGPKGSVLTVPKLDAPHAWNPLPFAAQWLSLRLDRSLDARDLLDWVIQLHSSAAKYSKPTIIKALLPRELNFAGIAFADPTDAQAQALHDQMVIQFGKLPGRMTYLGLRFPTVCNLHASELTELLIYGTRQQALIHDKYEHNAGIEATWIVPWGTSHIVSIADCGINRYDLEQLCEKLQSGPTQATAPLPVMESGPRPVETSNMAQCLSGFGGWSADDWRAKLDGRAVWTHVARVDKGLRGRRAALWNPVLLIDKTIQKKRPTATAVKARSLFNRYDVLKPWKDAWDEHASLFYPED